MPRASRGRPRAGRTAHGATPSRRARGSSRAFAWYDGVSSEARSVIGQIRSWNRSGTAPCLATQVARLPPALSPPTAMREGRGPARPRARGPRTSRPCSPRARRKGAPAPAGTRPDDRAARQRREVPAVSRRSPGTLPSTKPPPWNHISTGNGRSGSGRYTRGGDRPAVLRAQGGRVHAGPRPRRQRGRRRLAVTRRSSSTGDRSGSGVPRAP